MDAEALRQSLLPKFRDVTADRLEKISAALLSLEKDPQAKAPADDIARELHTMKGEARMLGLPRISELAHASEDLLKAVREGRATFSTATDLLLHTGDLIGALLEDVPSAEKPNEAVAALIERLTRACGPVAPAAPPPVRPESAPLKDGARGEESVPASQKDPGRSIRVAVDALDQLGAMTGDLMVEGARAGLRSRELASLIDRINTLGDQLLDFAERVASRLPDEAPMLATMEAELHHLRADTFRFARRNADGTDLLRGQLDRLADQVAQARLVPLSSVFAAFPRAVRDMARQQGKEVDLLIENGEVGVDRDVLNEVRDAMVHLLRNAVDHGIEAPEERAKVSKPRSGRVAVTVHADGGMLAIAVEDDGRGVDVGRLRELAMRRGVLTSTQAASLSDREALDLMFLPGFSTRDEITDLSGRGVGMSVVKKKVEALGGSVTASSRPGCGTRTSLRVPQSLALMRVLLVKIGNAVFGIPTVDVRAVGRVSPSERVVVAGREAIHFRGRPLALVELAPLLRLNAGPPSVAPPCVFVQHGEDSAAFIVDRFVGEREVAVKPCGGEFLKGAPFLAGAAALEDGGVAVLLHIPDVLSEVRRTPGRPLDACAPEKRLRILLVEDSPIARATEAALVRALGHRVDEAVDGVDGLEKISALGYDLVLADIQMPRMDGIELTRRLKADPATATLPIVILTSMASPEDKRRGLEAGADAYLIKGELSAETLARTLARLS